MAGQQRSDGAGGAHALDRRGRIGAGRITGQITRTLRRWARPLVGALILLVLVDRVGTGPFREAIGSTSAEALAVAAGIAALTTLCCAWRWTLVARGLGLELSLGAAYGAYYRSQFLNATLPGGVLGDVHRALRHGRVAGDLGRGVRAVVWERGAGQVVQAVLTVSVLLLLPSPWGDGFTTAIAAAAAAALLVLAAAVLAARAPSAQSAPSPAGPLVRLVRAAAADVRDGVLARRAWPGVVLASALAVAGHAAVFLLAAHTYGSAAPTTTLLPLAVVVLLASAVPTNIAGWGPREGAAAWAFAAAGLGAAEGATVAVGYGVMSLVATLPGALLLLAGRAAGGSGGPASPVPTAPSLEGTAHG